MFHESTDSTNLNTTPEKDVEQSDVKSDVESGIGSREVEYQVARAVTTVALEGFNLIAWNVFEDKFEWRDVFNSFKDDVFEAMLYFVWNLYDKEDFENIAFEGAVLDDCKRAWKLLCSNTGDFELESSLLDADIYENLREHDLCFLLFWFHGNSHDVRKDFSYFEELGPLFRDVPKINFDPKNEKLVQKAELAMKASDNLDPKGMAKKKLLMELAEGKCFCTVDALFMQCWKKRINFQKVVDVALDNDLIEDFLANVVHTFYLVAKLRKERLDMCLNLVTYPLSNEIHGTWDSEVEKIIKWADLKRRSEGRRFIGTDHLLFYLHQSLLSESPYKLEEFNTHNLLHNKPSAIFMFSAMGKSSMRRSESSLPSGTNEKHKDTIHHHLYQKASTIASNLGDLVIGLEHMYAAIASSDNEEISWRHSVESARLARIYWKGQLEVVDEKHVNPWNQIAKNFGEARQFNTFFSDLKKMYNSGKSLWDGVSTILRDFDKRTEMTEDEILSSLVINASRFPHSVCVPQKYCAPIGIGLLVAPIVIGMLITVCGRLGLGGEPF